MSAPPILITRGGSYFLRGLFLMPDLMLFFDSCRCEHVCVCVSVCVCVCVCGASVCVCVCAAVYCLCGGAQVEVRGARLRQPITARRAPTAALTPGVEMNENKLQRVFK